MAKFFRGDKRRREMDRKRRAEEKQRRLQFRREMRAKGLDPDMVDADGNPLPQQVDELGNPINAADEQGDEAAADEDASADDAADPTKP